MVLLNWFLANKYKVYTVALVLLVLFMQYSSMKKDFTHEKAMMQIEFREQKNKELQELRAQYVQQVQVNNDAIRAGEIQDSLVKANTIILDKQIKNLLLQKSFSYERNKAIDDLGSDGLRNYYRNLPKYNDYTR